MIKYIINTSKVEGVIAFNILLICSVFLSRFLPYTSQKTLYVHQGSFRFNGCICKSTEQEFFIFWST